MDVELFTSETITGTICCVNVVKNNWEEKGLLKNMHFGYNISLQKTMNHI